MKNTTPYRKKGKGLKSIVFSRNIMYKQITSALLCKQSCCSKIKGKKILYVKYDTMIFYLLFLNAAAFCLLMV